MYENIRSLCFLLRQCQQMERYSLEDPMLWVLSKLLLLWGCFYDKLIVSPLYPHREEAKALYMVYSR